MSVASAIPARFHFIYSRLPSGKALFNSAAVLAPSTWPSERRLFRVRLITHPDLLSIACRLMAYFIGGIIFAIFYPLSRKQHSKIVEELRQRREARKRAGKFALGSVEEA